MKERNLKKHCYIITNIAYAMAICFIWLLIETAVEKGSIVEGCESNSNNKVPNSECNPLVEKQINWEERYWELCDEVDCVLTELDIIEKENIEKVIAETKNKFISMYENKMPKASIIIDQKLLDVDLTDYYGVAIDCTNMITGRSTVFTTGTDTFNNNVICFEMPYGPYIINEIKLYTLDNDLLTEYKVEIEPFEVKPAIVNSNL